MENTSYIKELWQKVRHRKNLVVIVVITSFLTQLCFLVLPVAIQFILDNHISNLTANAWYETTSEHGVALNGTYWTQASDYAMTNNENAFVVYENEKPYLVSHVAPNITSIELQQGKPFDFSGNPLTTQYQVTALSEMQVKEMYETTKAGLNTILIFYLCIVLLHPLFAWGNAVSTRKFAREIIADFRIAGMRKLQKLPMDYFANRQDGKFISYLISDVSMFYTVASSIGAQLLQAFLMFAGIYIVLIFVDIRIFLGALLLLPILALWIYAFRKKILVYYEKARHASSSLNALLNEQFKGIAVIRAFNYEEAAEAEFAALNGEVYDYNKRSLRFRSFLTGSLVNVIRRSMWLAILLYAGFTFFGHQTAGITIGTIYLLISLVNYYVDPMYQFFGIVTMLEQSNVSIQRYFRYMKEEEEYEKPDAIDTSVPRFKGEVAFEHLNFSYVPENPVLKDINLKIKANQSVAIVGHTGSGKSSLMNLLVRFYDYKDGKITVDGQEITDMTRKVYREHVGIILQDPILFKGTLKETITWGDERFSDEMVINLLNDIGASDILEHADGIYQEVIEMGENFSLGQRQQIAFARAIIQDPSILVLDEATANIDTETERKIQTALQYASQNRTTFVIAHRLSTIQHSDVIVVLDKGVIVEQGTHQELLNNHGKYWEMYNAQRQN
jgi:ABC-type multidrug transport system, ATPase and permease components